jgi:hypothetical protein
MEQSTTPAGLALYPYLDRPDTRFEVPGKYSVKLRLAAADAQPHIDEIQRRMAANLAAAKERAVSPFQASRVRMAEPPYSESELGDGSVIFSFKLNALSRGNKKRPQRPHVVDMQGKRVHAQVTHGSLIRVSFDYAPWYTVLVGAGVSLKLRSVQVISLAQIDPAAVYGFNNETALALQ